MKITEIDIMLLEDRPAENPGWTPITCRVFTDEGVYGDGEAGVTFGVGEHAVFGALQDFARLIIGMDPLENEAAWERMYRSSYWAQGGGPYAFAAISALDVALWDIKGKCLGMPVWKLLGGKMRDHLRCYASQLQFGWGERLEPAVTLDDYARNARSAVDEGYDAVKVDFLTYDVDGHRFAAEETARALEPRLVELVRDRVAAVREAVGPHVDILMEAHAVVDAQSAVRLAREVEPFGIAYLEEPCTPDPDLTRRVSERVAIPLAVGERVYSRWQFAPYLRDGSVALVQPDIGNCGGMTEAKKICDMACVHDVGVQVHACSSPLLTAASLQLEAAVPNFAIHEHHVFNLHGYNRRLCVRDLQPVHGRFSVPDLPGLGNEFSDYLLETSTHVVVKGA